MRVAEGTRSRSAVVETDGTRLMLQEVLKKLKNLDARMSLLENNKQISGDGGSKVDSGKSEGMGRSDRRTGYVADRFMRQTKLKFPMFDGTGVHDWIFRGEWFFELDATPPELKVSIASVYLDGLAMDWHRAFIKNRKIVGPVSWEEYAHSMVMRFGPNNLQRPIAQLKRLKEGESFSEYVDSFVFLVSKVELSDEDRVALFVEGLKSADQKLITILRPKSLQQAIAFAKNLSSEGDLYIGKRVEGIETGYHSGTWGLNRNNQNSPMPKLMGDRTMTTKAQSLQKPYPITYGHKVVPYQQPHKSMSPSEMDD